ncbi:MAG: PqqD family protein [Sphingobacteriaceae bacterium]|nr:MAG: PqqD family protein [Sphingobacteriaceae bacterium]
MNLKKNIATSENGFIFNPATGDSFSGNAIASEILAAMKNGETAQQIKANILEKYDVRTEQLESDWEDWLMQLKQANLLEA